MEVEVNYLTVILAAVASMVVGFVWYGPLLFQKPWMKLMGLSAEKMKEAGKDMGMLYGASAVLALITAYVLSHVMTLAENFYQYDPVMTGLTSAFWMWLGFVMPVQMTGEIFGGKKWKLFAINTGYQLVSILVMGLVLGFLR